MTVDAHAETFAGLPVVDFAKGKGIAAPDKKAYRFSIDYDEAEAGVKFTDLLDEYLSDPSASDTVALVIGAWEGVADMSQNSAPIVEALVAAQERLPKLRGIFLGDITYEESEISWIEQSDVSPLLAAYPDLEHLRVRGGNNLSLGGLKHAKLKELIVEAGGLSANVVREVVGSELPELEHLELWLGDDGYGWDGSLADVEPVLAGALFPKLRYLGLKDSIIQDEIAAAAAKAPVTERLETLDISMGTLSDVGARALLESASVAKLKKLDIHHNYIPADLLEKLKGLGPEVDASDSEGETDPDDRYVEVAE
jgi:hypothetical protein